MNDFATENRSLVAVAVICCWVTCLGVACRKSEDRSPPAEERVARTSVERGPVTVTLEVDPAPARLSDELTMTLTIAAEIGIQVEKPPFGDGIGDFMILDFREPLVEVSEGREITRQIYTLEPTRAGRLLIDPIRIHFRDARAQGEGKPFEVETDPLEVEIESVVVGETVSLDDLRTLEEPVPIESPTPRFVWWLAGGLPILAALVGWLLLRRRAGSSNVERTPYEVAMAELAALQAGERSRQEVKRFYVELTGIVRRYIENTTGVRAAEQTTEEFLREITTGSQFDAEQRDRLRSFLESADLVKFAAHQPSDEDVDRAVARARDFIQPPPTEAGP